MIILDEISMVSSKLIFHLKQRLIEIFRRGGNKLFAWIPLILCGDLYQLPPVSGKPIYIILDLWEMFRFAVVMEVLRQRGVNLLIHALSKICVGDVDESVNAILKEQFISPNHP